MCSEECCKRIWHRVVVQDDKNQRTIFRVNWKVLVRFTLCVCVWSLARHSAWIIHYGDTRTMWPHHSDNHSINIVIHLIQFRCPFRATFNIPHSFRSLQICCGIIMSFHFKFRPSNLYCWFLLWNHWNCRTLTLSSHSLVAWWSDFLTSNHEVPGLILGSAVGIFPCRGRSP
jgi:hypothetical protein